MPNIHDAVAIDNAAIRNSDTFFLLGALGVNATTTNPAATLFARYSLDELFEYYNGPTRTVRASGSAVTDDALFSSAVTLINNAANGGTIFIDGMLRITNSYNITKPVFLCGVGSHSGLIVDAGKGITIGTDTTYVNSAGTLLPSNISQFDTIFDATGLGISSGDFGLLVSDGDAISVYPKDGTGNQRPAQLVQVNHLEGTDANVHGAIWDNYTHASKKWVPITMLEGVRVSNLIIENVNTPSTPNPDWLVIAAVNNFQIDNIRKAHPGGGGEATLKYCSRGVIRDCRFDGIDDSDAEYHFTVNCVNGLIFANNNVSTARHFFTTAGAKASGSDRWGTPCNILLTGNVFNWSQMEDFSGQSCIDTHPEGYGISVIGNHFHLGRKAIGVTNEARRMVIAHNAFWMGDNAKGVKVSSGYDTLIYGNHFVGSQANISLEVLVTNPDRTRIINNYFHGGGGGASAPVIRAFGDNTHVIRNHFEDWSDAAIELSSGSTGIVIEDNYLKDSPNATVSIDLQGIAAADVTIRGNQLEGYGVGELGFDNDTNNINEQVVSDNVSDKWQTVATTDATETTLLSFTTANDHVYTVKGTVLATETTDHDEAANYVFVGTFKNDGGVLSQVGTTTPIHTAEDTAGWAADFDTSGTSVRVRVTGAGSTNINWRGYVEISAET